MRRLSFFFVLGIILISPLITYASDYTDGMNAMKNGNHEEAVKFFRIAADSGDSRAQHCLGVMLSKGQGVNCSCWSICIPSCRISGEEVYV